MHGTATAAVILQQQSVLLLLLSAMPVLLPAVSVRLLLLSAVPALLLTAVVVRVRIIKRLWVGHTTTAVSVNIGSFYILKTL